MTVTDLRDLVPAGADLHIPAGIAAGEAMRRTTDLGVVAHADDLELLMLAGIGACYGVAERGFGGVVCTDGTGSVRAGRFSAMTDAEFAAVRMAEQRRAADIGQYSFVLQLGRPSPVVRSKSGHDELVADLERLLRVVRPVNVYTHDLTDSHPTHVAVAAALVAACRRLPTDARPTRVVGCEGWRSLDWLPDDQKVLLDTSPYTELGRRLIAVFESQLSGGKRYDLAAEGRRRSNATLHEPRRPDSATEFTLAMDLTPLARNDEIDPVRFASAPIETFRDGVSAELTQWFGTSSSNGNGVGSSGAPL
ncbi:MAG: PIG-L family deacetylase [Acidimicrobiales bacterium]|nr:PIG-L family deacetylase [Acidimicrobiales bacterium]